MYVLHDTIATNPPAVLGVYVCTGNMNNCSILSKNTAKATLVHTYVRTYVCTYISLQTCHIKLNNCIDLSSYVRTYVCSCIKTQLRRHHQYRIT